MSTGVLARLDNLLLGGVFIAPAQVFQNGTAEQNVVLQNHGHRVSQLIQLVFTNIVSADDYPTLDYVIKPWYKLNQRGLGRACSADNSHGLTGFNVKVNMANGAVHNIVVIAECYVLKYDRTVLGLQIGIGVFVSYVNLLVYNLNNSVTACLGVYKLNKRHGNHHQRHKYLTYIGNKAYELTRLHVSHNNQVSAEPEYGNDTGVYNHLHNRHVYGNQLLRRSLHISYLGRGIVKLLVLVIFPYKRLDNSHAGKVLLNNAVKFVHLFQHKSELGNCELRHKRHHNDNNRHGKQKYKRQLCVNGHGHHKSHNKHYGGSNAHTQHHHC